jgi:hypothetical protein
MVPFRKLIDKLLIIWLVQLGASLYIVIIDWEYRSNVISDGIEDVTMGIKDFFPGINMALWSGCILVILAGIFRFFKIVKARNMRIHTNYYSILILLALMGCIFTVLDMLNNKHMANPLNYKTYTTQQVLKQIKSLANYQGDSIMVYKSGRISSQNELIQSYIDQMYIVPANLSYIQNNAKMQGDTEGYWVYKMAIHYYIQAHPEKNKNPKK